MKIVRLALLLCIANLRLLALDFYVSAVGNDGNSGTADAPFETITRARNAIRDLKDEKGLPKGGVTVWLTSGIYNQSETFSLDDRDSGSPDRPIIYSALPGQEVRITGADTLDPSWFTLVDSTSPVWSRLDPLARGKVYSTSLKEHGIADYGALKVGGFHIYRIGALELFIGGRPMTLGQWPNKDQPLERTESAPSNTRIMYSGSRPERWSKAPDIWLHGLWNNMWADFHVEVASIDTEKKAIDLAKPPPQFGLGANQPYYAYNLLEEIDEPEEYYLDRSDGRLYVWPPGPLAGSTIQASMLGDCLLEMTKTEHITLRGLTLEATRGPLLQILDGDNNRVEGCLLRNCVEFGAKVTGSNNGLDQCEILNCGEDGVLLGGGIRSTLTAGNNFVTNCRIRQIARIDWTYHPAIVFSSGCGNLASHNLLEDLPHAAVIFSGNNHTIEFNEIRRVCLRTEDVGAIYAGREWSYRGNIIRSNFVHHLHSEMEGPGPHGVYLDDGMSGVQVLGNVFYRIDGAATYYGGGRDNITKNNIMAANQIAHCNGDYDRSQINNKPGSPWNFLERLAADDIHYQEEPWLSAYPACAAIPNSWQQIQQGTWRNPEHCVFSNNGGWSNLRWVYETNFSRTGVFSVYDSMSDNDQSLSVLFSDDAAWDRSLRPAELRAPIKEFTSIPFSSIGPSITTNASSVPQAPRLKRLTVTSSHIDLQWANEGDLPWQQATGTRLLQQDGAHGEWREIRSFGADCDFASLDGLAPGSNYAFRVESYNTVGSARSNVLKVLTLPTPPVFGASIRFEAENPLQVLRSIGKSGAVGAVSGPQVSGKCVTLFDPEDSIRISFTVPSAGIYQVSVRVRSGAANLPIGTEYWPNAYKFKLDDNPIRLEGSPSTVSAMSQQFGPTYWGTMYSEGVALTPGSHAIDVTAAARWAAVDFLEVAPLASLQVEENRKVTELSATHK